MKKKKKKDRVDRISGKMGRNKTKPKTGSEENKRMKITDKTNKIEKELKNMCIYIFENEENEEQDE